MRLVAFGLFFAAALLGGCAEDPEPDPFALPADTVQQPPPPPIAPLDTAGAIYEPPSDAPPEEMQELPVN